MPGGCGEVFKIKINYRRMGSNDNLTGRLNVGLFPISRTKRRLQNGKLFLLY